MTDKSEKVLALITARGGSKGLPGKNIIPLKGKPLIAWTIEAAKNAKVITDIVVTTDDERIAQASIEAGARVPFMRPPELATDTAGSKEVVLHALDTLNERYDYVILLQPTSPLRTATHIDEAFALLKKHDAPSCVSVKESEKPAHLFFTLSNQHILKGLVAQDQTPARRQDAPPLYAVNGALYIFKPDQFENFITPETIGYVMGQAESVDIDDAEDFAYAAWRMSR
ncbi:MAG: acylneuraminate cytidylyltransferase family protein [Alphaproteobacteria bacterium]|nr:acylneuraminate cytidylyltransferase family protein [Alphaproteobacteria bacterium]